MSDIGDSTLTNPVRAAALNGLRPLADYLALLKPRVMSLVVFTAFCGLAAAPGEIATGSAIAAILCIALGAGASGALNMWYDADIDAKMSRTAHRPIPSGRLDATEALLLGTILSVISVVGLGFAANWAAAALLAITIQFYVIIYTIWLKRRSVQNIVIGGASGAFPPMIGWAAVTGSVDLGSIALFLIIFLWTPPHFWALALFRAKDYKRAGVPMLPVIAGADETRKQIAIYTGLMIPASFAPYILGISGTLYAGAAFILGAVFIQRTIVLLRHKNIKAARGLFTYSILYLFALFSALLLETLIT